jgi:hypothetical protein
MAKKIEKKAEGAFELHKEIIELKNKMGFAFVELGRMLKTVRDEGYYQVLGYDSFQSYVINSELGFKRRTAYYYIEIYDWFVYRLGFTSDYIGTIGQDKLLRVLEILKKEFEDSEKYPIAQLKARAESLINESESLRPVDFEKKYKDEKKQEGHEDYLPPPEYVRCDKCGKWKIILPLSECCTGFLSDMHDSISSNILGKEVKICE